MSLFLNKHPNRGRVPCQSFEDLSQLLPGTLKSPSDWLELHQTLEPLVPHLFNEFPLSIIPPANSSPCVCHQPAAWWRPDHHGSPALWPNASHCVETEAQTPLPEPQGEGRCIISCKIVDVCENVTISVKVHIYICRIPYGMVQTKK